MINLKSLLFSTIFLLVISQSSCVFFEKNPEDIRNELLLNGLTEPRFAEVELRITIRNVTVLQGNELIVSNREKGIPDNTPPTLKIWCSQPQDYINQKDVRLLYTSPEPDQKFTDKTNGNLIFYRDLANKLKTGDSIVISARYKYTAYNYTSPPELLKNNQSTYYDNGYERFLKQEDFIELSDSIKSKSNMIVGSEKDPHLKAKLIYNWVRDNMKYAYPVLKRSAAEALRSCTGDCGQYSYLFIALCRSATIPSRLVSGFMIAPDTASYHVWSEIQLPGLGWLPVDCTDKNGFLNLDNRRLVTSRGMNIPLTNVPLWANYQNSEANGKEGKTDFMQLATVVMSGMKAEIRTQRLIIAINRENK
jgi:hypothetical protein